MRVLSKKGKKADKTRRSWSEREEEALIQALKEASVEGWKSGNGFRAGYLGFLENRMKATCPNQTYKPTRIYTRKFMLEETVW